jgi:hypothetical protein
LIKPADNATPHSSALIGDAAAVMAEAIVRMARRPDGGRLLSKFNKVIFVEGRKAGASIDQGVMRIVLAPDDGLAGRPSSERIVAVAAGS